MNPQQIIRWGRYFCGLSEFFAALAVGFFSHGDIVGALVSLFGAMLTWVISERDSGMKRISGVEIKSMAHHFWFVWVSQYGAKNADKLSLAVRREFKKNKPQQKGTKNGGLFENGTGD